MPPVHVCDNVVPGPVHRVPRLNPLDFIVDLLRHHGPLLRRRRDERRGPGRRRRADMLVRPRSVAPSQAYSCVQVSW